MQTLPTLVLKTPESFSGLDLNSLAAEINQSHVNADDSAKEAIHYGWKGVVYVINSGNALIEAKRRIKSGDWLLWLESHIDFDVRTAQNYMRCAERYTKSISQGDVDFQSVKQLYQAAGVLPPNTPVEPMKYPSGRPPIWLRYLEKLDAWLLKADSESKARVKAWAEDVLRRI